MITLEDVEKLRQYANVSYGEAKAALEATGGNLLDAIVLLEKNGKIAAPEYTGSYSYDSKKEDNTGKKEESSGNYEENNSGTSLFGLVGRFISWCGQVLHRANLNALEVRKNNRTVMKIPAIILAILLLFAFWLTIPLIILGLLCGYKFTFTGPDLGKDSVNRVMEQVSDTAGNIVDEVKQGMENGAK